MVGFCAFSSDADNLAEIMRQKNLPWRSFKPDREAFSNWNYPATPAFYILDREGTIRHQWFGFPGNKTMDRAIENFIAQ